MIIILIMAAHLLRDGTPSLGSTTLARLCATLICALAGFLAYSCWVGVVIGLCIGIGFWTDTLHGEGQEAKSVRDVLYLSISGVTSITPLALFLALAFGWIYATIALVGLAKVPLWFGSWWAKPQRIHDKFYPTRVAAVLFGAVIATTIYTLRVECISFSSFASQLSF